jgi:hypothetical protein
VEQDVVAQADPVASAAVFGPDLAGQPWHDAGHACLSHQRLERALKHFRALRRARLGGID